jgi:hypothetical protein
MKMSKKPTPNAVDAVEALTHQVALDAAEHGTSTAKEREWSRQLGIQIDARLAELRRKLTPAEAPVEKLKPIRPSTLAMARDVVLGAIQRVCDSMGGTVAVAHRNLKRLSDDDLRRLYDLIDPTNRDAG